MSQKKHQPGCPCCPGGGGDCCDGTDIPTITISGWTLTEGVGASETCCIQRTFEPDSSIGAECCVELPNHSIDYQCVKDWYTFIAPVPLVSSTTLPCPLPDEYCCPDPPVKVATITTEETVTLRPYFVSQILISSVKVIWGKEEIDCGGTVSCRYFVKLAINVFYRGVIRQNMRWQGSVTASSADACLTYDGSLEDNWDVSWCTEENICDNDLLNDGICAGPLIQPSCFSSSGLLCVERIKYFDTLPTGDITFTSSDVPGSCDEPMCNQECGGYANEICLSAPENILPPIWCETPPTVSRVTNNYVVGSSCVGSKTVLNVSPFDCCNPLTQICNTDNNCETAWSQTCEEIEYPDFVPVDEEECRYIYNNTFAPVFLGLSGTSIAAVCSCQGNTALSFLTPPDCTATPCPACCHEPVICTECPYCYPKYAGPWFANNDITVTVNCSAYVKPADCCFTIPPITVNISYA